MPQCPNCKQEIKYIYSREHIIPVNLKERILFNQRGRELKGFEQHFCEEEISESNSNVSEG